MTNNTDCDGKDSSGGMGRAFDALARIRTGLSRFLGRELGAEGGGSCEAEDVEVGGLLTRDFVQDWLANNRPDFLNQKWLENNLFISSQRLAKLRSTFADLDPKPRSGLLTHIETFIASGDRRDFIELFLANWPEPYFAYSVTTALSQSQDEALAELLRPMRRRLAIPNSPSLYETGEFSFIAECIDRGRSLVSSSVGRSDGIQLLWVVMALTPFSKGEIEVIEDISSKYLGPEVPDGEVLLQYTKLRESMKTALRSTARKAVSEEFDLPLLDTALSPVSDGRTMTDLIQDQIDKIAPWAKWFDESIEWTYVDLETLCGIDPAAEDAKEYDHVSAASFLAATFLGATEAEFPLLVDAVMDARKEAGLPSSFLCQKAVDHGLAAADAMAGTALANAAAALFSDDDYRAIATLYPVDHYAGENMLFALAVEGYDDPDLCRLALLYGGAVQDYLRERLPLPMQAFSSADIADIRSDLKYAARRLEPQLVVKTAPSAPVKIDFAAKYDGRWLEEAFFASEKSRLKIEAYLLANGIAAQGAGSIGHRLTASFRYRQPLLKQLRDEAASQFGPGSVKRDSFTLFPGPQREFDRTWRAVLGLTPFPAGPRWNAIAQAISCGAAFDQTVAAEAFLAQVAEADLDDLRSARDVFAGQPCFRDFLDQVLAENTSSSHSPDPQQVDTQADELPVIESPSNAPVKELLMPPAVAAETITPEPETEWAQVVAKIAGEIKEAAANPPAIEFIERFEAYGPLLKKLFEEHAARKILSFGQVRDKVLPLLIELRTVVPKGQDELDRALAEVIARIEAVQADVAWTKPAADEALSLAEAIAALQEKAKRAFGEAKELGEQMFAMGRYELGGRVQEAGALAAGATREVCDLSVKFVDLAPNSRPVLTVVTEPVAPSVAPEIDNVKAITADFLASLLDVDEPPSAPPRSAEAVAELARIDAAVTEPEAVEPIVVEPEESLDFALAEERILELAGAGSFASAFHVAAALEACGGLPPISSAELRLVATAPYLNLPAMQINERAVHEVRTTLEKVLAQAQDSHLSDDDDAGRARRLLMFAGAIGPALLGRDTVAIEVVRATSVNGGWDKAVYGLKEALARAGRGNAPITIERCRQLASNADAQYRAETARTRILNVANQIATNDWPTFQAGREVAKLLSDPQSEIGEIVSAVRGKSPNAAALAAEFASTYHDTVKADDLLQRTNKTVYEASRRRSPPLSSANRARALFA